MFFFLLPLKMHSVDSSFLPSDECLGGITWLFCSCNYFQVPKEWKCAVWEIKEKKKPLQPGYNIKSPAYARLLACSSPVGTEGRWTPFLSLPYAQLLGSNSSLQDQRLNCLHTLCLWVLEWYSFSFNWLLTPIWASKLLDTTCWGALTPGLNLEWPQASYLFHKVPPSP